MTLADALGQLAEDEQWQANLLDWQRECLLRFAEFYLLQARVNRADFNVELTRVWQILRAAQLKDSPTRHNEVRDEDRDVG